MQHILSIIVVIGRNREIGCQNRLLWNIPEDMARFKKKTTGHVVIMGSKTYESIGQPLTDRINVVIAIDKNYQAPGCIVTNSIDEAVNKSLELDKKGEIFVIGGGSIYEQMMPKTDKLYLTLVDDSPDADTFFPDYSKFTKTIYEKTSEHEGLKFKFIELEKP